MFFMDADNRQKTYRSMMI